MPLEKYPLRGIGCHALYCIFVPGKFPGPNPINQHRLFMQKSLLTTLVGLCFTITTMAQVKGNVSDSASGNVLGQVQVALVDRDNPKDTVYSLTDEKGNFSFSQMPKGNFVVLARAEAHRPVSKFVTLPQGIKSIDIGKIILPGLTKILGEVFVEAPAITIKEDTIEYRADAFKVKENAVVEDLLKKLPGIEVDKDGNIKAQGQQVKKVKVNGKEFFGGDVKTATRELSADMIDKVQIIDDYGDQATVSGIKDGQADKVLNLQLKKDKNHGYFGRATVGAGTQDRYQASFNGNYFKNNTQLSLFANSNNTNNSLFNFSSGGGMSNMMRMGQSIMSDLGGGGGIMNAMNNGDASFVSNNRGGTDGVTSTNSVGFNYRDQWSKKISAYGSYSYSHRNTQGLKVTSKQNLYANKIIYDDRTNNFLTRGDNHRVFMNIEYNIDAYNYLKISPNFSFGNSDGDNLTPYFALMRNDTLTQSGNISELSNSQAPNFSATVLYNHKFKKKGRNFSASLNLGSSMNNSETDSRNTTRYYEPPFTGTFRTFQFTNQENNNNNYGLRFTYSEPLSKTRALDLALSHNFSYAGNNRQTYIIDPVSGNKTFSNFLSNNYENDFITDRANLTVRTTLKKYNYTLGISFQPVNLQGKSITKDSAYRAIKRLNVFPVARFVYNFSRTKSLNINYNGNAQQPSFTQLQDVVDSTNRQYITKGNPNLKPSTNHNLNMSFNNFNMISGKVFFSNLNFSTVQNQIVYRNTAIGNSGAQLSAPENVNGYYNANAFYMFSRPYKNRRYVISLNGNLNFNHNINLVDNARTIGNNWVAGQGMNFEFNHKDWLELGAGISYNLNSVHYSSPGGIKSSSLQNQEYSSWIMSSTLNLDIPKNWVLKYDFNYTLNNGLSGSVARNLAIMNASIEKQLFKKKNGIIRLQAFDLFNQNTNISRNITTNTITDTRTNRLTRYFLLTLTMKIQKFKGQQPQQNPRMMNMRMGGGN